MLRISSSPFSELCKTPRAFLSTVFSLGRISSSRGNITAARSRRSLRISSSPFYVDRVVFLLCNIICVMSRGHGREVHIFLENFEFSSSVYVYRHGWFFLGPNAAFFRA